MQSRSLSFRRCYFCLSEIVPRVRQLPSNDVPAVRRLDLCRCTILVVC
jgi:hypothetical protein